MSLPVIPFSVLALVYMCGIPAKLAKQNRKKGFLQYTTLVCTACLLYTSDAADEVCRV